VEVENEYGPPRRVAESVGWHDGRPVPAASFTGAPTKHPPRILAPVRAAALGERRAVGDSGSSSSTTATRVPNNDSSDDDDKTRHRDRVTTQIPVTVGTLGAWLRGDQRCRGTEVRLIPASATCSTAATSTAPLVGDPRPGWRAGRQRERCPGRQLDPSTFPSGKEQDRFEQDVLVNGDTQKTSPAGPDKQLPRTASATSSCARSK
jgi:hypothetical protein